MRHALFALPLVAALPVLADPVEVVGVEITLGDTAARFDVTVAHPDTGWEHYADAWEILGPDGARLGIRELAHPHVEEQPFTRSLFDVTIPEGVTEVTVRARCLVDGWTGGQVTVAVPRD